MKKMFLSAVFAFCTVIGFCQQRLDGFEFLNRDIDEILYTVSLYRGVAIVGDDTISGKATFRFAGQDFDSAFESFLSSQRLYVQKTDDVWTVSRVKFSPREDGVIFLDASDVRPAVLVEKISREFGTEITYDALGEIPVSLHTGGSSAGDFVKSVVRVLGKEYSMEDNAGRLRINRTVQERNSYSTSREKIQVRKDKENFSVDVQEASVGAVLEELFKSAGKEYIFAADTSAQIKRAMFSSRSFDAIRSSIVLSDPSAVARPVYTIRKQVQCSVPEVLMKPHRWFVPAEDLNSFVLTEFFMSCHRADQEHPSKTAERFGRSTAFRIVLRKRQCRWLKAVSVVRHASVLKMRMHFCVSQRKTPRIRLQIS